MANMVSTTVYLEPRQVEALKLMKARDLVPIAKRIRQGIDAILEKNKDKLKPEWEDD